jgi:hypothetical protein
MPLRICKECQSGDYNPAHAECAWCRVRVLEDENAALREQLARLKPPAQTISPKGIKSTGGLGSL